MHTRTVVSRKSTCGVHTHFHKHLLHKFTHIIQTHTYTHSHTHASTFTYYTSTFYLIDNYYSVSWVNHGLLPHGMTIKFHSFISCMPHLQDIVFNISGGDSSWKWPRYTLIMVEMGESVAYLRRRVSVISQLGRHRATFSRVAQFRVRNRIVHHRSFTSYFRGTLRGYGKYIT